MSLLLALAAPALAEDGPHLYWREYTALAVGPTGVATDLAAEARAPVLRLGGAVFNDTFVGAGARVAVTPVHAEVAARLSAQPIDILPITVELTRAQYWESPWGPVAFDSFRGSLPDVRSPLYEADEDFPLGLWVASVSPTFQLRVGPIVGFTNWTASILWAERPAGIDEPLYWEPYRGMILSWTDTVVEHQSAALWEPLDGEDRSLLRVGALLRGKRSLNTADLTLQAGGLAQLRPGPGTAGGVPTFTAVVAPYLRDPDFVGRLPFCALVATWDGTVPFGS